MESLSNDVFFNGGSDVLSSVFNASASNGISGGHQIGLVVADMSHLQYQLGEGYDMFESFDFRIVSFFSFHLLLDLVQLYASHIQNLRAAQFCVPLTTFTQKIFVGSLRN